MIKNFEDITKQLSYRELNYYVPLLKQGLETKIGIENIISTPEIIKRIHEFEKRGNPDAKKLEDVRIRIMVRHIIINDMVPCLVSSRKGFYVATKPSEIDSEIQSLDDRITAIQAKRKAWIRQKEKAFFETQTLFE